MPTLKDLHESLSRKQRPAKLASMSDHAAIGTVDFDYEIASFASSNISLCAEAGSSSYGSSIDNEIALNSIKQRATLHVCNISNTAVCGDETPTTIGKERYRWTPRDFEDGDVSLCHCSKLNFSTAASHSLLSDVPSMPLASLDSDMPDFAPLADKVCDFYVPTSDPSMASHDGSTRLSSRTHQISKGSSNNINANMTRPTRSATKVAEPLDTIPCAPSKARGQTTTLEVDEPEQQHKCCIAVLSAFEEAFLSDEDKQAILEGGCHGLCAAHTALKDEKSPDDETLRASNPKPSPPARGPSDRPARFISSMPSEIMSNGHRGEKSTLPRFSRRRVAAEYKKPRLSLPLVEHPSRKAGGHSGLKLAERKTEESIRCDAPSHLDSANTAYNGHNKLFSTFDNQVHSSAYRPRRRLKRQAKQSDLRHKFESDCQLAKKTGETGKVKEKRSSIGRLLSHLATLF